MREIDHYFLRHEEPIKGYLMALRCLILTHNEKISEAWRYKMPFYLYEGKRFCYLWVHRKHKMPYIGIVNGSKIHYPELIKEKRTSMKILLLDPTKDVPLKKVKTLLKNLIRLYACFIWSHA